MNEVARILVPAFLSLPSVGTQKVISGGETEMGSSIIVHEPQV
jgi:hypothetical protein